jgi:3-isopropylmalate/(R)-2-methylmalate dehydratase small subunit
MNTDNALTGRAWVFGDDINTDILAPGIYMKAPIEEMATHCLEAIAPDFANSVRPGDIVIAGDNFGIGSSREQAAQVLKILGISAIVARSFGGIFYRNAINFGLLAITCNEQHSIKTGEIVTVDALNGQIENPDKNLSIACDVVPAHLMAMVSAGGLVPFLERKLAKQGTTSRS